MDALKIIGTTVGSAVACGLYGGWKVDRKGGDDFGIGLALRAVEGVLAGGLIGLVVSSMVFA